jgi:ribosome-associated heat shock protein Hsp15
MNKAPTPDGKIRLDKWLWAARLYKTRSISAEEIDKGRVTVNAANAKPGREVRVGDRIELRSGPVLRSIVVRALSGVRGPAPVAALLYEETAESVAQRQALAERRRLAPEPADSIAQGRPSKRDRRELDAWRQAPAKGWNERWSASLDD